MKTKIKISELRAVCEVQEKKYVEVSTYENTYEWETQFIERGKLETVSGLLYKRGQNSEPVTTHKLTIRYRPDMSPDYRIRSDGVNFTIHRMLLDTYGAQKYLVLELDQEEIEV